MIRPLTMVLCPRSGSASSSWRPTRLLTNTGRCTSKEESVQSTFGTWTPDSQVEIDCRSNNGSDFLQRKPILSLEYVNVELYNKAVGHYLIPINWKDAIHAEIICSRHSSLFVRCDFDQEGRRWFKKDQRMLGLNSRCRSHRKEQWKVKIEYFLLNDVHCKWLTNDTYEAKHY